MERVCMYYSAAIQDKVSPRRRRRQYITGVLRRRLKRPPLTEILFFFSTRLCCCCIYGHVAYLIPLLPIFRELGKRGTWNQNNSVLRAKFLFSIIPYFVVAQQDVETWEQLVFFFFLFLLTLLLHSIHEDMCVTWRDVLSSQRHRSTPVPSPFTDVTTFFQGISPSLSVPYKKNKFSLALDYNKYRRRNFNREPAWLLLHARQYKYSQEPPCRWSW